MRDPGEASRRHYTRPGPISLCPITQPGSRESCRPSRPTAPGAGPETDFLRQMAALPGVVRRHHWIVGCQTPALAIGFGRHIIGGLEVSLQHFELLAVFETDDVIGLDRFLDADRR